MGSKLREKMIAAMNRLTGRDDCSEVVVLQQRPVWVPVALFGVVLVLMFALPDGLGAIGRGAIAGGCGGLVMALATTTTMVGRFSDRVVMASMAKMQSAKPVAIIGEVGLPAGGTIEGGLISRKVTFNGADYLLHRSLEERFRAVMA